MKLTELLCHFYALYGRRNNRYLPKLLWRINFLNLAIGDLQEAIRKEAEREKLGLALARIISRAICIAHYFPGLPVVEMMARKFPVNECSYCHQFPCQCVERRPDPVLVAPSSVQQTWRLGDWARHFDSLYGQRNRAKGIENLVNRLFKEVAELMSLAMSLEADGEPVELLREEFALEVADVLAWTLAIANYYGIDVESKLWERYGNGCWKCRQNPCLCPAFSFKEVRWDKL